jgi:hypothetical protein
MNEIKNNLIKIAYENPELRGYLLPLISKFGGYGSREKPKNIAIIPPRGSDLHISFDYLDIEVDEISRGYDNGVKIPISFKMIINDIVYITDGDGYGSTYNVSHTNYGEFFTLEELSSSVGYKITNYIKGLGVIIPEEAVENAVHQAIAAKGGEELDKINAKISLI